MATEPRVQFQLRPINLIPDLLAAFIQENHKLKMILSLKPMDLNDGKSESNTILFSNIPSTPASLVLALIVET